jgi:hypothetical protein
VLKQVAHSTVLQTAAAAAAAADIRRVRRRIASWSRFSNR